MEPLAAVCLLLYLIGWQALMGVLFLIALIPCVMKISSACSRLRNETAKVADQRMSLMNELVTGIRALKTHAWEENYRDKVKKVRRQVEVKLIPITVTITNISTKTTTIIIIIIITIITNIIQLGT